MMIILCISVERLYVCFLNVPLRSCVFVLMMIILCVIVISVERNTVLFGCAVEIMFFVLMMLFQLFGCTVEIMCFCVDDDNFMCCLDVLLRCTVEIICFCVVWTYCWMYC
uniref:Uncharacterized protein n=2 Tax=Helianthus annuus TaxID=4232 RepID=A0A251TBX4_HELAN